MSRIVSYTIDCQKCGAENRLPLTNEDIPRDMVREEIFECDCGARLGGTNEEHRISS
jgi:hypothetical protein